MFWCFRYYRYYPREDNTLLTVETNFKLSYAVDGNFHKTENYEESDEISNTILLSLHRITESCYLRHKRTWKLSLCSVETWVFQFIIIIISLEAPLLYTVVRLCATVYTTVVRKENVSHEGNTFRKRFRIRFSGRHPFDLLLTECDCLCLYAISNDEIESENHIRFELVSTSLTDNFVKCKTFEYMFGKYFKVTCLSLLWVVRIDNMKI